MNRQSSAASLSARSAEFPLEEDPNQIEDYSVASGSPTRSPRPRDKPNPTSSRERPQGGPVADEPEVPERIDEVALTMGPPGHCVVSDVA